MLKFCLYIPYYFSDQPIQPIKELLRIECTGEQELTCEDFIEVELTIVGSRGSQSRDTKLYSCLFAVLTDSNNKSVI